MRNILLFLVFLILSCSSETEQNIPVDFESYVGEFFAEGLSRGFNTRLEDINLSIEFGEVDFENAGGQCTFRTNRVVVDREAWGRLDEEGRTWLIVHELGHCVLDRHHKNEKSANGECFSFMKGAEDGFKCSLNLYSNKWWSHYYDELFMENTAFPSWYGEYDEYGALNVTSVLLEVDTVVAKLEIEDIDLPSQVNFRIDMEFENTTTDEILVQFYLDNIAFAHCDVCTGNNVSIRDGLNNLHRNFGGDIRFDEDIKLSLSKIDDDLYFYINERFIHTFEASVWTGEANLSTVRFDEVMPLRITISELD